MFLWTQTNEYRTFTMLPLLEYDPTHTGSTRHKFLTFVKFLYSLLNVGSVSCHVCRIMTSCADLAYKLCGIGISVWHSGFNVKPIQYWVPHKKKLKRERHRKTGTENERDTAYLSQGTISTAYHECWRGEVVVWIWNVRISCHAFDHIVCYILLLWLRYYFSHKVGVPSDKAWPAWLFKKHQRTNSNLSSGLLSENGWYCPVGSHILVFSSDGRQKWWPLWYWLCDESKSENMGPG